jgi:hypothetical protein
MLAASTGVLMKIMSESPDADFVLNRNLRRTTPSPGTAEQLYDGSCQAQQIAYQSECDFHEGFTLEATSGQSHLGSGGVIEDWNADSTWFATAADM